MPGSTMRTRQLTARAALVTACVATATACGSTGNTQGAKSTNDSLHLINAAYSTTTGAKTARMSLTTDFSAANAGSSETFHETGDGQVDFARKAITETLHAPMAGLDLTTIKIGQDVYTGLPQSLASGAGGKRWTHIQEPTSAGSSPLGQLLAGTGSAGDPAQVLRLLSAVSSSVTRQGTDSVRGQQSTHYHALIDLARVAAQAGPQAQCAYEQEQKLVHTPTTLPVDVWLDGQGRLTRVTLHLTMPKLAQGRTGGATPSTAPAQPSGTSAGGSTSGLTMNAVTQGGTMTMTEEFYDFGAPVSITAPPASQTRTLQLKIPSTATGGCTTS